MSSACSGALELSSDSASDMFVMCELSPLTGNLQLLNSIFGTQVLSARFFRSSDSAVTDDLLTEFDSESIDMEEVTAGLGETSGDMSELLGLGAWTNVGSISEVISDCKLNKPCSAC